MTYEEMLNAKTQNDTMPFGVISKKQVEGKYRDVVTIDDRLLGEMGFRESLQNDCRLNQHSRIKQQLHYELNELEDGKLELELESGSYQTFAQLLNVNPAIVAKSGFVDNVVSQLFDGLVQMHEQAVFHLSFAPNNLLIRKGDEMPMMLLHASSFGRRELLQTIYADGKDFIAPEVWEGQPMTEQSDIYSLGCFIRHLYEQGDMPYEYKQVVGKATQSDPQKRYSSVQEMRSALQKYRGLKRSLFSFVGAVAVVLCLLGLYIELMPNAEDVEFVEAPPKEQQDELVDGSFTMELDDDSIQMEVLADSGEIDTITVNQRKMMELYMQKSEEIFKKQFTQEADRILTKIYSNQNMNASEKKFMSSNNEMYDELLKLQNKLAEEAGISDDAAARLSMEIIDKLSFEKQKQLEYNSSQPNKPTKEDE